MVTHDFKIQKTDAMWEFTAKDVETTIEGLNEFLGLERDTDVNTNNPKAEVKFTIEAEAREYGIKYLAVGISSVECEINCEVYAEDLTEDEKKILIERHGAIEMNNGYFEFTIKVNSKDFKDVESDELTFADDGAFSIDEATIDLKDKAIVLQNDN